MFDTELLPLYGSLFNTNSRPDLQGEESVVEEQLTLDEDKYHTDLSVLEQKYGRLQDKTIDVTLSDILGMLPRKRQRTDAYNGLVKWLKDNRNTTLNIKSRKSK